MKYGRKERRREEQEEPLIDAERQEDKEWDVFVTRPTKINSRSAIKSKYINFGIKFFKVFTSIFTFILVLGSAVVSKGTLFFMTSQIKKNITRPYCNKYLDKNKQFVVSLPEEERVVWIWLIIFTFMVPELGTFLRSVRIMCFKTWRYPSLSDFGWLFITESLPTVGSAFLVFIVLPELDVIKGAMLTNAVCFIPGLIALFSKTSYSIDNTMKFILNVAALAAQASAFVVWPLIDGRPILYFIPASVLLISVGWWENFISKKSSIQFMRTWAEKKQEFENKTYFTYSILALWKCLLFLSTTVVIMHLMEGNYQFLFDRFVDGFKTHAINIVEIVPDININDVVAVGSGTVKYTWVWTPLLLWLINISSTYVCYSVGKFACRIRIQAFSFAFPINLSVPVLLTAFIVMCGKYNQDVCAFQNVIPPYLFFNTPSLTYLNDFIAHQYSWIWLVWLLSQTWITRHIWTDPNEKLAATEKLFFRPMYDAYLIDQSVALNRKKTEVEMKELRTNNVVDALEINDDEIIRIYACATMWHETQSEMVEFLKSILRMDEDQCAHRTVRNYLRYHLPDYYEFETHILFDDAFETIQDHQEVNKYVLNLMDSVSAAASEVHKTMVKIKPPVTYSTPYGGRLEWTLPGKTKMIAHLKDRHKVKLKKRWSQVMYMYYLLGYRIMKNEELTPESTSTVSDNIFLLTLDGDIDFQPHAVHLLVDLLKRNKIVGAACGRIHPISSGAIAWYQKFEYAIGHWLQKTAEHVFGCVLCSPGCFSLFRAKALMDHNVLAKYKYPSAEARHFVQYDQGEDRWLCTLLLKRGYRIEYCAASDAYTHCPEGFNEFYYQRRRWIPSTIANTVDLLANYLHVVQSNDNISMLYILYQLVLTIGVIVGPGTIFLVLLGAFETTLNFGQWSSLACNLVPVLLFVFVCATCKTETQVLFAGIISGLYGLVMMAVLIAVIIHIQDDGWLAPSSLFFYTVSVKYVIAGLLHPQEIHCLIYGFIYYISVPGMYMLLGIFSIFNMNNVSWGTREAFIPKSQKQNEEFIEADLKDLKDRVVVMFVMANSLLILTVFLLNMHSDRLYLNWPIYPKVHFTFTAEPNNIYIEETYLRLEPTSFVFLIGFGVLMVLQFVAMLYHRFGTYSHILANTNTNWHLFESDRIENLTDEEILKIKPIKIFKKLITLEGINDNDSEMDKHVERRNTVFALAVNNQKKTKPVIEDLDQAFETRMENSKNPNNNSNFPIDKKTLEAISKRREEIQRRMSEKPASQSGYVTAGSRIYEEIPV